MMKRTRRKSDVQRVSSTAGGAYYGTQSLDTGFDLENAKVQASIQEAHLQLNNNPLRGYLLDIVWKMESYHNDFLALEAYLKRIENALEGMQSSHKRKKK